MDHHSKNLVPLKKVGTSTGLLLSVRNEVEAKQTLGCGVDILDIKEPANGALGMVAPEMIRSILEATPPESCVSIALGELREMVNPGMILSQLPDLPQLQFAKIGLSGLRNQSRWKQQLVRLIARIPESISPVGVVYADDDAMAPTAMEVVETTAEMGGIAVLVDTFEKSRGNVFEHLGVHNLEQIRHRARRLGMAFVLAGSLGIEDLETVKRINPDYVGIRGAACRGRARGNAISQTLLKRFRDQLDHANDHDGARS